MAEQEEVDGTRRFEVREVAPRQLLFAREPVQLPAGRILRHPKKHSGHVELELCTAKGVQRETVSRKQGQRYKVVSKVEWGDEW